MKIIKPLVLAIVIILNIFTPVLADRAITLEVNGEAVKTDTAPIIENGRTLIPARAVFEDLGATVSWEPATKCVTIKYDTTVIMLFAEKTISVVNTDIKNLDVPAKIVNGRTLIPVRFVATELNMQVSWDDITSTVSIVGKDITPLPEPEPEPTPEPEPEPDIPQLENEHLLSEISVRDTSTQTTITLSGVSSIPPSVLKLENPARIVFDFKNCSLMGNASTYKSENPNISSIRSGQFSENTTRIVIDLKEFANYTLSKSGKNLVITFKNNTTAGSDISEAGSYVSHLTLKDSAKDKLLFIDPGHGGSEVGTIGKWNGKDIYEKDVNIKLALLVNEMLINNGVNTYMVRTDDEAISVSRRPEIANEMGAHFYMSLHNNAAESSDANGVQICYASSTAEFSDITNREISGIFYNNIASLGLRKAGLLDNPRYIVIYKANMPSIIVESAFMSNQSDLALLMDDEFIIKLAQKICDSAIEVMNKSAKSDIMLPVSETSLET